MRLSKDMFEESMDFTNKGLFSATIYDEEEERKRAEDDAEMNELVWSMSALYITKSLVYKA